MLWGIGPGPWLDLATAGLGLLLLWRRRAAPAPPLRALPARPVGALQVALLALLVFLPLVIPTSWTQVDLRELREQRGVAPPAGG